jgi:hypothetical protein
MNFLCIFLIFLLINFSNCKYLSNNNSKKIESKNLFDISTVLVQTRNLLNDFQKFNSNAILTQDWLDLIDFQAQLAINHNYFKSNLSETCSKQVSNLINGLRKKQNWSLRLVDSYGKLPAGLLNGNLLWMGDFEECLNITVDTLNWTSKYCYLTKNPNGDELFDAQNVNLYLKYGMCAPNDCSTQDIATIVNSS